MEAFQVDPKKLKPAVQKAVEHYAQPEPGDKRVDANPPTSSPELDAKPSVTRHLSDAETKANNIFENKLQPQNTSETQLKTQEIAVGQSEQQFSTADAINQNKRDDERLANPGGDTRDHELGGKGNLGKTKTGGYNAQHKEQTAEQTAIAAGISAEETSKSETDKTKKTSDTSQIQPYAIPGAESKNVDSTFDSATVENAEGEPIMRSAENILFELSMMDDEELKDVEKEMDDETKEKLDEIREDADELEEKNKEVDDEITTIEEALEKGEITEEEAKELTDFLLDEDEEKGFLSLIIEDGENFDMALEAIIEAKELNEIMESDKVDDETKAELIEDAIEVAEAENEDSIKEAREDLEELKEKAEDMEDGKEKEELLDLIEKMEAELDAKEEALNEKEKDLDEMVKEIEELEGVSIDLKDELEKISGELDGKEMTKDEEKELKEEIEDLKEKIKNIDDPEAKEKFEDALEKAEEKLEARHRLKNGLQGIKKALGGREQEQFDLLKDSLKKLEEDGAEQKKKGLEQFGNVRIADLSEQLEELLKKLEKQYEKAETPKDRQEIKNEIAESWLKQRKINEYLDKALNALRAGVMDPDEEVREAAIRGMGGIKHRIVFNDLLSIAEGKNMRHEGVKEDDSVRVEALYALKNYQAPETINACRKILKSKDEPETVKTAAASVLAWFVDEKSWENVKPLMKSSDPEARKQAVYFIGRTRPADGVKEMFRMLEHEKETDVIKEILDVMWFLGGNELIPKLIELYEAHEKDADSRVKKAIISAAKKTKKSNAARVLEKALDDEDREVVAEALDAVKSLRSATQAIRTKLALLKENCGEDVLLCKKVDEAIQALS
ncbi:HEAT repeats [Candidatus Gugararchaeum adminiculabundum]|nr:HEAT repeats [Candidatus Gugararchaeum adminiculabundum]